MNLQDLSPKSTDPQGFMMLYSELGHCLAELGFRPQIYWFSLTPDNFELQLVAVSSEKALKTHSTQPTKHYVSVKDSDIPPGVGKDLKQS